MKKRMIASIINTAEIFNLSDKQDKTIHVFIRFLAKIDLYGDAVDEINAIKYILSEDKKTINEIYSEGFWYIYNPMVHRFELKEVKFE